MSKLPRPVISRHYSQSILTTSNLSPGPSTVIKMSQQETFTGETISDESIKKTHDFTTLATPPVCVADFCLIPIGTPTASVSNEVAQVQRLLKKCGLSYSMHSAGTTVGKIRVHSCISEK